MKNKSKTIFTTAEIEEIKALVAKKVTAESSQQKSIRNKIRRLGLFFSDFGNKKGYGVDDVEELIRLGSIKISDSNENKTSVIPDKKVATNDPSIKYRIEGLLPVVDHQSEILILGTMPGKDSLATGEYYASSNNSFWKIISHLFNQGNAFTSYEDKIKCLKDNHIALWDVYQSAIRESSLDADIKDPINNDLERFLNEYPSISRVIFNGKKAQEASSLNRSCECFGSTSNCNAKKIESKIAEWSKILNK